MWKFYKNMFFEKYIATFRGNVSYEFDSPSGDVCNLAYTGAKNLNFWPITGFVYLCFKINKACYTWRIEFIENVASNTCKKMQ